MMASYKIVTYPNSRLKQKAEPLHRFGPEEQRLFDDMIEVMYREEGVGLAAPQIGIPKRIFVAVPSQKRGEEWVAVNPEIYESSGRELGGEGCLSVPGVAVEVPRATRIRVRYQNRHGESCDLEAKDFIARVIQHEIDHLDGILIIDRVPFDKRQEILSQYQRL